MTTEPKLLTEAEWLAWMQKPQSTEKALTDLRARGLIAEEPVDPFRFLAQTITDYLNPQADQEDVEHVEGLIRNTRELAPRKELTREVVEEMTFPACDAAYRDVYCDRVPEVETAYVKAFARHFHAALTEALQ